MRFSSPFRNRRNGLPRAFTLVELLAAMSTLVLLLLFTLSITSHVSRITASNGPSFQEARTAFETITRMLSQALLNPYWDYDNPATPNRYIRASELHFVAGPAPALTALSDTVGSAVFFQAPLGYTATPSLRKMPRLLNSLGFYVRFSTSPHIPPYLDTPAARSATAAYRLWMFMEPAEEMTVYDLYNASPQAASDFSWFRPGLAVTAKNHVLANHVILLLIRSSYRDANGDVVETYMYDSRPGMSGGVQPIEMHQIPETLHVTLVAIDDATATRLLAASDGPYQLVDPELFDTASDYANDLVKFQDDLNGNPVPVHYRIFESTVNVSASKWSR